MDVDRVLVGYTTRAVHEACHGSGTQSEKIGGLETDSQPNFGVLHTVTWGIHGQHGNE